MLKVDNLHKNFGSNQVIKDISFSAKKGEVISILGKSGSGKSTLLRCINFLEIPTEGSISLLNQNVSIHHTRKGEAVISDKQQIKYLRTKIGMVFQQFNLWAHMTAFENVCISLTTVLKLEKTAAKKRALKYLDQVNMLDRQDFYPAQLSGGQQQRVAIARALAMEPAILLFDEPTSALDPELIEEVLSVLRKLAEQGLTMLIVTHEVNFAKEISNRIIFIDNGRITEEGEPQTLFNNPQSTAFKRFIARHSGDRT